ncbi:MAG: hypothetical protein AAF502_07020 [Bacteroidota bacterium]
MAKYANKNFDPDILIINVVFNDFNGSFGAKNNPSKQRFWTYTISDDTIAIEQRPNPASLDEGRLNRLFKSCATGQYWYHNLKLFRLRGQLSKLWRGAPKKDAPFPKTTEKESILKYKKQVDGAIDHTIRELKAEFPKKRIIFTLDGLRKVIYDNQAFDQSDLNWMRLMLFEACAENDIEFIDFSIVFQQDYQANRKPFEFKRDPHWNVHAHQLVATTLFDYLMASE